MVWGTLQIASGWASDLLGRKPLIVAGMALQGIAIVLAGVSGSFASWIGPMALLGLGTALVYPTLLAAIGDAVPPTERATSLGAYRFWRDGGFVAGALSAGVIAALFGMGAAIISVGMLTAASGVLAQLTVVERTRD